MVLDRGAGRTLQELVIDDVQSDQRDRRAEDPTLGDANARPDMRLRERSMRAVASITSLRLRNQTEPEGSQPGRVQASESEGIGCGDPWRPWDLLSRALSADTGAGVGCPPDVGLPI
jgi:hypothetical protein